MDLSLKALAKQTSVYGVFQMLQRALALIVIPLYSHYLTPAEFGSLDVLYLIVWFIGIVGGSKLDAAFIRYYAAASESGNASALLGSSILGLVLFASVFCAAGAIGAEPLLDFMYSSKELPLSGFYLALAATWLELVGSLPLAYLRANQEARLVGSISLCRSVVATSVGVIAVTVFGLGVPGILLGGVAGGLILVCISYWMTLRRTTVRFSMAYASALYKYALPMLPAPLFMYVLNYADRYFLLKDWSLTEVGVYAMGYKFAMLLSLAIMAPFGEMWGTAQFALFQAGQKATYKRLALLYISLLYLAALCIVFLCYEVATAALDKSFHGLILLVAPLTVGVAIWGIVPTLDFGCLVRNKTWIRTLSTGLAALANVLLNMALIPSLGALGAALATLLSFVLLALITHWLNRSLTDYCVDIERATLLSVLLIAFASLVYLKEFVPYALFCVIRLGALASFAAVLIYVNRVELKHVLDLKSVRSLRDRCNAFRSQS